MTERRFRYYANPFREATPSLPTGALTKDSLDDIRHFHESLPEYAPTPLVKLDNLASCLGVGSILIKDEAHRFGINSFKGLGAAYAIRCLIDSDPTLCKTVSAATEGNHGRGVAWMAKKLGLKAVIFVPERISPARVDAIRQEGASIVRVEGSYQDTVSYMAKESVDKGYSIISDTGYAGYTVVPGLITAGYFTLFLETEEKIKEMGLPRLDCIFLQGGVGTFASSGISYFSSFSSQVPPPKIVTVEPIEADCLLASATSPNGTPQNSSGRLNTRMCGLNCGFPSIVAWPIIRSGTSLLLAVRDEMATRAVDLLSKPSSPDPVVKSTESGAAGLAGLLACCQTPETGLREFLGLGADSNILLVNTEGPLEGFRTDSDHLSKQN